MNEAVSVWKAEYIKEVEALKRELTDVTKSQEFINLKYVACLHVHFWEPVPGSKK